MIRTASTLALLAPFFLSACVSGDKDTDAPIEAATEASADQAGEELDPNDPNVMVCPVTGQMQRIDADGDGSAHDSL